MGLKPVSFKTKIFGGSVETYHGTSLLQKITFALCPFDKTNISLIKYDKKVCINNKR